MPHFVLLSLCISAGRHFPSLSLEFADGLNVLIGARGTGKSGILHYILFALGCPLPPGYAVFAPKYDEYLAENLGPGVVTLKVRTQHDAIYTCVRALGDRAPRVYAEDGALTNVTLGGELFQIDAYAQGSLEAIGHSPATQLELLDRRVDAEAKRVEAELADVERRLTQSVAERARLAGEIADDEGRVAELPQVTHALKALELPGGEDPAAVARASELKVHRGRERTGIAELTKAHAHARQGLDAYATGALARFKAAVNADLERGPHAPSAEVFRRAHEATDRAAAAVERAAAVLRTDLEAAAGALAGEAHALAEIHAREDEAYHALVVRQDSDRARAAERERLHRRFEELSAVAKRLDARRAELSERLVERERLLDRRAALLVERSTLRQGVAARYRSALGGVVDVRVDQAADTEAYAKLLADITRGASLRGELLVDVARSVRPRALLAAALAGDVAVIEAVDPFASGKTVRATKLLNAIAASERRYELDTVPVGDVPRIALCVGGEPQPAEQLSPGQLCTCLLPMVLMRSASCLLADQPEDHLDNRYLRQVLIPMFIERQAERQMIVATHNANIPVLGNAKRVFELGGGRWSGRLEAAGSVDETRGPIESLLDGGKEAFLQRAVLYGHLPRR